MAEVMRQKEAEVLRREGFANTFTAALPVVVLESDRESAQ
jgi:hypothetical protein